MSPFYSKETKFPLAAAHVTPFKLKPVRGKSMKSKLKPFLQYGKITVCPSIK